MTNPQAEFREYFMKHVFGHKILLWFIIISDEKIFRLYFM